MFKYLGLDPTFEAAIRLRNRVVAAVQNSFGSQYGLTAVLAFFYFIDNPNSFSAGDVKHSFSEFDMSKLEDELFCNSQYGLSAEEARNGVSAMDTCDEVMLEKIVSKIKYMTERSIPMLRQGLSNNTKIVVHTSDGPKPLKG